MSTIAVYSGQQTVKSWGWRHALAWRQLSVLWRVQVSQHFTNRLPALPGPASAYSLAITPDEFIDLSALGKYYNAGPVVAFLDHIGLDLHENVATHMVKRQTPPNLYRHVFSVDIKSPLTSGLPRQVVVYGALVDFTPLRVEPGVQVLVSLDGVPVIGYRPPHLFIGADAWQLGNPSVPLVYPILNNWLRYVVGLDLHKSTPYAMIRLDDLPTTAEELLHRQPTPGLDYQRAAMLRRLRKFAQNNKSQLSLMYSSHYYSIDGSLRPIGNVMPRSIQEMRLGLAQNVFEIGAHGMVHLRHQLTAEMQDASPQEFFDLDSYATKGHLLTCVDEIWRLFRVRPSSFVAPAWGYRPGVTKNIAGQLFKIVIDSSQNLENGSCEVFGISREEFPALNCIETFRFGSRMLSYTTSDFWRCYAVAGIPVHYMQHAETNWDFLQDFIRNQFQLSASQRGNLNMRLVAYIQNSKNPLIVRALSIALLSANIVRLRPASLKYLWKLITTSSLYTIVNSLRVAGYQCVGLNQYNELTLDS